MSSTKQPREKKKASLGFSILTVLVLIAFITLMLTVGKAPIVVVMILAWLVLVPFALYLGYSMHETEKFALDLIKPAIGVIALLIAVGGMVSIWLCAGTVPALIYWGLKIISPARSFSLRSSLHLSLRCPPARRGAPSPPSASP